MSETEHDETDFHLPGNVSWSIVKQWFKAIYSWLISLKECMGQDVEDMVHPRNYWHHNQACQEYLTQLREVQCEIDVAIDLARGTYFDEDSIHIKKRNSRFVRFEPDRDDERSSSNTYTRDRVLSSGPEDDVFKPDTIDRKCRICQVNFDNARMKKKHVFVSLWY